MPAVNALLSELVHISVVVMADFTCNTVWVLVHHINEGMGSWADWTRVDQEPKSEWDTPRVSPYRLAAHLTSAFVIYSGLLWTTFNMFFPTSPAALAPSNASGGVAALRRVAHPLAALIAVTALSGDTPCRAHTDAPKCLACRA